MKWNGSERKRLWDASRSYSSFYLQGQRKDTKTLERRAGVLVGVRTEDLLNNSIEHRHCGNHLDLTFHISSYIVTVGQSASSSGCRAPIGVPVTRFLIL
jgi:hypothetical protein